MVSRMAGRGSGGAATHHLRGDVLTQAASPSTARQERPTWQRVLVVSQATLGDECGACVVVVPCLRRTSSSIVSRLTSGGVEEGGERGRSEGVGRVGGAVL